MPKDLNILLLHTKYDDVPATNDSIELYHLTTQTGKTKEIQNYKRLLWRGFIERLWGGKKSGVRYGLKLYFPAVDNTTQQTLKTKIQKPIHNFRFLF